MHTYVNTKIDLFYLLPTINKIYDRLLFKRKQIR